jgi:hypothetical protein
MTRAVTRSRRFFPRLHAPAHLAVQPVAAPVTVEEPSARERYRAIRRALRIHQRHLVAALEELEGDIDSAVGCHRDYWSLLAYEVFGIRPPDAAERERALLTRQRALRLLEQELATARQVLARGDLDRAEQILAVTAGRLLPRPHRD